ncbi:zinc-ribbon domain-containing protein [Hahella aquimaris]|uniref:zinc-ribbon domain-containing protein n=1 Tax=Hahella sp. HNIBRBA332 TaxID=3015983 RepID=UPI00352C919D
MFKKSGLQRRKEIKAARLERAKRSEVDVYSEVVPKGALPANTEILREINPLERLPNFYIDRHFICKDCESHEIWTAKQQKWWYEIARGSIASKAVRCRSCRYKEKRRKEEARRVHLEGLARKYNK